MKSNQKHSMAVRLYDNPKFGKTFGKGLYHNTLFNGTVDLPVLGLKYLIDLVQYEQWQHTAKSDQDMEMLATAIDYLKAQDIDIESGANRTNILCSWIKRFDSNMLKPKVPGFALLDLQKCKITVVVTDEQHGIAFGERLCMRSCKDPSNGQRSPNYFASNYDADTRLPLAA
ncbi:hypothetical protein AOB54_01265 [beta proteobacterium MWH-UniP1]